MIIKRFEATESSSGGGIPVVPIAIALVLANVVIWGALVDGGSYFENGTWDLFDQNWSRNDQYGSTDKKTYSKGFEVGISIEKLRCNMVHQAEKK